jgi:stringent starvation protein B
MNQVHTEGMKMPQSRARRGKTAIQGAGKARITISLSKDKVRFIKAHSGQAGARSVSAFIERLVAEAQARTEREKLGARTALYYDSLSALETENQRAWGRLGELGLAHTGE